MAQSIVAAVVGVLGLYMLVAAVQRRALAELFIGVFFVASAVGSETALRAIFGQSGSLDRSLLMLIGIFALTLSTASAYAFVYTVFRRGEAWALTIVTLGTALTVWGAFIQLGVGRGAPDMSGLAVEYLYARFLCFAWGTYEALRAYNMARKRLALGLADPVVVNRFLLFGIWFGAMGVMPVTLAWARITGGAAAQAAAAGVGPKLVGLVMIAALILTFFPPRKYLSWVLASTKEATS